MDRPQEQINIPEVNVYELLGRAQSQVASLVAEVSRLRAENETLKTESESKLKAI